MSLRAFLLVLMVSFLFNSCGEEEDNDYPSRNQPPALSAVEEPELKDPLDRSENYGPSGPMQEIPGSEYQYPQVQNPQPSPQGPQTRLPENHNDSYQRPYTPEGSSPEYAGIIPTFVVMGGYKSCQFDFHSNGPVNESLFTTFRFFLNDYAAKTKIRPQYLMTCYVEGNSEIRYVLSSNPTHVKTAKEGEIGEIIFRMTTRKTPLVFIGHSMGGWLAMHTIDSIAGQQTVSKLFTIDPISPNECTRLFAPGCRRAPADFGAGQLDFIASSTKEWTNFYQRVTPHLMSSKIPAADNNHLLFVKHGNMDSEVRVWTRIRQSLIH